MISFTALEMSVLVARFFEFEGCKLGLKWPNDLWDSRGRKCGGILVQGSGNDLYAGVGVNLFSDHKDFGGVYLESFEFDKKSWSLRLAEFITTHRYSDTQELKKDWELRCQHMGAHVTISEGQEVAEGIFSGLGNSGEAILNTAGGNKPFYNGTLRIISSVQ
jgi:biotin-(acetyl-CoA carboxylase) ligase